MRVIADHIRSCAFLIADGVMPSNEGRGYVLRRIIRRAVRHGYQLGGQTPFFYKLVSALAKEMGSAYPELFEKQELIKKSLEKEELRFAETLDQGLKIFEQKITNLKGGVVPGDLVFLLYDTYGFPVDLTADVARERDLVIDEEGFDSLMEQQRDRARSSSQFAAQDEIAIKTDSETDFIGYTQLAGQAKVLALQVDGEQTSSASAEQELMMVLDTTPFYAEGGGQVGDKGIISASGTEIQITDCRKLPNGAFVHMGKVLSGEIKVEDSVAVKVNSLSRNATAANHSATHLMHSALKQVLGDHVIQKGSMVNAQRLRFDFAHDSPVTAEQISDVEALVNAEIFSKQDVKASIMPIDEAKAAGAEALFGEKYGAEVRVLSMGDFSLELCGGTHVSNTAEIGFFKIVAESGVAAGVRRIEALTREGALQWVNEQQGHLRSATSLLKADASSLTKRIEQLQTNIKTLEQDKKKLQVMISSGGGGEDLASKAKQVGDITVLATIMEGADKDLLRNTIDSFKDKNNNGIIVLGAKVDNKVKLVAGVAKSISKRYPAGKLIQHITALADGRGGGRPDMAEGGIADVNDLEKCLAAVEGWVAEQA